LDQGHETRRKAKSPKQRISIQVLSNTVVEWIWLGCNAVLQMKITTGTSFPWRVDRSNGLGQRNATARSGP
jgi:hypothetical protein